MAPADTLQVTLAVGVAPREVRVLPLTLPVGSTVRDALREIGEPTGD